LDRDQPGPGLDADAFGKAVGEGINKVLKPLADTMLDDAAKRDKRQRSKEEQSSAYADAKFNIGAEAREPAFAAACEDQEPIVKIMAAEVTGTRRNPKRWPASELPHDTENYAPVVADAKFNHVLNIYTECLCSFGYAL
jgi:hypothetical protein